MAQEQIVITLDPKPAIGGLNQINAAQDATAKKVAAFGTASDKAYGTVTAAVLKNNQALVAQETLWQRVKTSGVAAANAIHEATTKVSQTIDAVKNIAKTIAEATAGTVAATTAVATHTLVADKLVTTYRAARLLLSPTLFTAVTLGAGVAAEAVLRLAYAQAESNRQDALRAVQTGRSYNTTSTNAYAARVIGMDVAKYGDILGDKTPAQVEQLVADFSKLKDPVDKAAFAVKHFGDQAEAALPLLTDRLRRANEQAYEFSSDMNSKHRAALESFAVALEKPANAIHSIGDAFRALWQESKQWPAIKIAMVVEAYQQSAEWEASGRQEADPYGGMARVAANLRRQGTKLPDSLGGVPVNLSPLQAAQSANDAAKKMVDQFRPTGMVGGEVSDDLLRRSSNVVTKYDASSEGLSRQFGTAQSKLQSLREQLIEATGDKAMFAPTIRQSILTTEKQVERLKPLVESAQRSEAFAKEKLKLVQEGTGFITVGNTIIKRDTINKANEITDRRAPSLFSNQDSNRLSEAEALRAQSNYKAGQTDPTGAFISPNAERENDPAAAARAHAIGLDIDKQFQHTQDIKLAGIQAESNSTIRLLELRTKPGGEVSTAQTVATLRQKALDDEYQITNDIVKLSVGENQNRLDLELKLAEAEQKRAEKVQEEFDHIKGEAEGLFHTMFTDPKNFGRQLTGTLRDAALKPIESKLAETVARPIQSMFGVAGKVGDANKVFVVNMPGGQTSIPDVFNLPTKSRNVLGLFNASTPDSLDAGEHTGFPHGPLTANSNAIPTFQGCMTPGNPKGDSILDIFTAKGRADVVKEWQCLNKSISDSGKVSLPSLPSKAENAKEWQDIKGSASKSVSDSIKFLTPSPKPAETKPVVKPAATPWDSVLKQAEKAAGGRGGPYAGDDGEDDGGDNGPDVIKFGPGGTPPFVAGPTGLSNDAASSTGAKAGSQFDPRNILKNLKGTNWGSLKRSPGENNPVVTDENGKESGGKVTGVNGMAGAALSAGGMALAQHGLMGNDRGTGKGALEGMVGGGAVGYSMGGPLGAAIGAGVGLTIGLSEMAAGLESPQREARRLVKQRYGMNIDGRTADAIVGIAQSKYGGKVSIAVVSPEVRDMLSLYAASTGQKSLMSSTTPHGASFSEQGGQMTQDATYQFGRAYSYQSSVPVSGGVSTQTYNNQPVHLSLNVDGQGAGDFLAGNVVTPDFVQSRWSQAQAGSNGRVSNSMAMQSPGLVSL